MLKSRVPKLLTHRPFIRFYFQKYETDADKTYQVLYKKCTLKIVLLHNTRSAFYRLECVPKAHIFCSQNANIRLQVRTTILVESNIKANNRENIDLKKRIVTQRDTKISENPSKRQRHNTNESINNDNSNDNQYDDGFNKNESNNNIDKTEINKNNYYVINDNDGINDNDDKDNNEEENYERVDDENNSNKGNLNEENFTNRNDNNSNDEDVDVDNDDNDDISDANDDDDDDDNDDDNSNSRENISRNDEDVDDDDDGDDYDSDDDDDNNEDDDEDDNDDSSEDNPSADCHLQRAIISGESINIILELIELFPTEIQCKNKLGDTPLHTACAKRHNIAIKLIELFPKATQHKNSSGLYPIHYALQYHPSEDVMINLIEIFPDSVIELTKAGTALHFACKNKAIFETIIRKLVEMNPLALQEKDYKEKYPIEYAICRPIAIIKILLDNDPLGMQRKINIYFDEDMTPFHFACQLELDYLVEYLMQRSDLQINARDNTGKTPLHYACKFNQDIIVGMILHHPDVDVNATDSCNETPLHTTLRHSTWKHLNDPETLKIIQKLLDHPFILINGKNNKEETPLDMIKSHMDDLANNLKRRNIFNIQSKLEWCTKIIHLLKEFSVKKRWKAYCYHVKDFDHCS